MPSMGLVVAGLTSCDGFTVESPNGCLGWVEETWLDAGDCPVARALRTTDGRRPLLRVEVVRAADPDAQQVLVSADTVLRRLEPPRLDSLDGDWLLPNEQPDRSPQRRTRSRPERR